MKPETSLEQAAAPLAAAAEQVLETMFFTTIDGPLACVPETAEEIVSAALLFRGELSGVFRLDVSVASARRMAAAFLAGEPQHLSPARVTETVCELANMICGCALSHIRGENIFELLSPHLSGADDRPLSSAGAALSSATQIFQLEDGFLRVSVEVR
ncbi:MAG TPA: chemotaxis protein CheX [Bryobacteraceae bacterium]